MIANLVVVDGELFDEDAEIRDVWVGGRRHEIKAADPADLSGDWSVTFAQLGDQHDVEAHIEIDEKKLTFKALDGEVKAREVKLGTDRVAFLVDGDELGLDGIWLASAVVEGEVMHGTLTGPQGSVSGWSAERSELSDDEAEKEDEESDPDDEGLGAPEVLGLPFGAYGYADVPVAVDVLVRGATLWTAGPDGIIENGDLLVIDGKIAYVGPRDDSLVVRAERVVDAAGRHVTPGLIDCHSHTGISRGVNEAGGRVTAEVAVADVINPDDINWYRQLAGGLTAANQLHGSANAIGGQNSVVKLRWGVKHPDDMRMEGAKPGIKFALGENPKRSNFRRPGMPQRSPTTRMGVMESIRDRFQAAKDYMREWEDYRELDSGAKAATAPPRRDLQLDALVEILRGERLVHSHSYRQDEILALIRVADEFGFKIATFQHVLEGYKVAEAIKEHAIGASAFSDWWAYKVEAFDAIPHNAALLKEAGANIVIKSDDRELVRHLYLEAAKTVRCGNMHPDHALQTITRNSARELGLSDRMGTIEVGKDADLAIFSGHPLNAFSRCEMTLIEGEVYFVREDVPSAMSAEAAKRSSTPPPNRYEYHSGYGVCPPRLPRRYDRGPA